MPQHEQFHTHKVSAKHLAQSSCRHRRSELRNHNDAKSSGGGKWLPERMRAGAKVTNKHRTPPVVQRADYGPPAHSTRTAPRPTPSPRDFLPTLDICLWQNSSHRKPLGQAKTAEISLKYTQQPSNLCARDTSNRPVIFQRAPPPQLRRILRSAKSALQRNQALRPWRPGTSSIVLTDCLS